jgi:hypothetical protein
MMEYTDIQNLIKGKTIAIVGNAESILSKEEGIMIDGFQVVIRMNYGFVYAPHLNRYVAPKQLGKITTLVCAGNGQNILGCENKFPGMKGIVHMSGGNRGGSWKQDSDKFYIYPLDLWEELKNLLTKRPSTGMMVIDMVKNCNPDYVSLFGFDFKKTKTYYNDGKGGRELENVQNPIGPHNWKREQEYTISICRNNGWDII